MSQPSFQFEKKLMKQGFRLIAGLDEVGRGPLAGPVVAAAVILGEMIPGLNDSKLLTPAKRTVLCQLIKQKAWAIGLGLVAPGVIDKINIYQATLLAMHRAVLNLKIKPDYLLIDGKIKLKLDVAQNFIVGGDKKCCSIAAASIVAKVYRDQLMFSYHKKYPQYGFGQHKGYGTKLHFLRLQEHGPCAIHRQSFAPVKDWAD